jgi:tetratricopeptide (TPR) repeat protein
VTPTSAGDALDGETAPEALLERASALIDLDRDADAVGVLASVVAADPANEHAYVELARAHLALKQYDEVLSAAGAAARLNPSTEMPHRFAAFALVGLKRGNEALAAAQRAVTLDPDFWATHAAAARALEACGRTAEALGAASNAVRLAPDEPSAHLLFADIASDCGRDVEAEAAYRRTLELDPDSAVARHDLAVLHLNSGKLTGAVHGFASAAASNPALADTARENLVAAGWRTVSRVRWVLLGSYLVVTVLSAGASDITTIPARIAAAAGLVTVVTLVTLGLRAIPPAVRSLFPRLLRRAPGLAVALAAMAVATGALAAFAVWPNEAARQVVINSVCLAVLLMVGAGLVHRFRNRR